MIKNWKKSVDLNVKNSNASKTQNYTFEIIYKAILKLFSNFEYLQLFIATAITTIHSHNLIKIIIVQPLFYDTILIMQD